MAPIRFVKLLMRRRDAELILNRVYANNVAVPVGKVMYTQWLNSPGGIEAAHRWAIFTCSK